MTGIADAGARRRALDLERHVIAVAPAGSGKTGVLVQRFLAALATVDAPEQVVAISFTNKAAAEIRQRVAALLHQAQGGTGAEDPHAQTSLQLARKVLERDAKLGWNLRLHPDRLQAQTIDGFNAQIAAELPLLSGLGGRPGITEDARALYDQALMSLFEQALSDDAETDLATAAAAWLRGAGNRLDRLLPALADLLARREQWAQSVMAADSVAADEAILQTLHRQAHRRLTAALGPNRETLIEIVRAAATHAEPLRWAMPLEDWPPPGVNHAEQYRRLAGLLVTRDGQLRKPGGINAKLGFAAKQPATSAFKALVEARQGDAELAAAAASVQSLPPAAYPAALAALRAQLRVLLRQALAHLNLAVAGRGETDFTGVALAALQALRPDDSYGEALLRRDLRIRHLLVDEMQDTSLIQLRLIEQLTSGWQAGDGHSLFLVGDPQQSIYAFRKAEVSLFMGLWRSRRLGGLDLDQALLQTNFRSAPELIEWFNAAFQASFPTLDDETAGQVAYRPALTPPDAASEAGAGVAVHAFDDHAGEALAAAERAAQLISKPNVSVAILARARRHLDAVLAQLRRQGVAYACQDIDALATTAPVRDLLACARALWHPEDRLHWAIWLRAPWVGLSWTDLLALSRGKTRLSWPQRLQQADTANLSTEGRRRVERLRRALDALAADSTLRALPQRSAAMWSALDGPACVDRRGLADVYRVLQLLETHCGGGGFTDLEAFQRAVDRLYASPAEGVIQVMTVHKAKGLEFDHVLLIGCGRKPRGGDHPLLQLQDLPQGPLMVPRPPAHWPEEEAGPAQALFDYVHGLQRTQRRNETLRLVYVATTRARRTLDLFVSLQANAKGEYWPPTDSFAAALWPTLASAFALPPQRAESSMADNAEPPLAPRLPLEFVAAAEVDLFVPRELRSRRPSEKVLSARDNKREEEFVESDTYARLVGTMFHQAMAYLTEAGIDRWSGQTGARAKALAAGLRRMGLAESRVQPAVRRIIELVDRVLTGEHGRWLLRPRRWQGCEYALSGYLDGAWVAAVIDRCFEDEDGLWIVDYKVRAEPLAAESAEDYVQQCIDRYARQLRQYAELMVLHRPTKRVRTALYLVEIDRLVALE